MLRVYDFQYLYQMGDERHMWWIEQEKQLGEAENIGADTHLYVTDDAAEYAALKAQKKYVVPYLREKNRGEQFPDAGYAVEKLEELGIKELESIYRRMAGIPWDICETERCRIRETAESDWDSFHEIYREESVSRYMEKLPEDRERWIARIKDYRKYMYGFYGYGVWTVMDKRSGRTIGRAGLSEREECNLPDLGFVIGTPWQRQGYAYEVCRAVLRYAGDDLGMEEVQAFVQPPNMASAQLCRKLGFVRAGQKTLADGICYDRYLLQL